jgi:hypothetical protein
MNKETLEKDNYIKFLEERINTASSNETKTAYMLCLNQYKKQIKQKYSEEEVIEVLTQRCKEFGTENEKFQKLLLKQDLEWFEQYKKK